MRRPEYKEGSCACQKESAICPGLLTRRPAFPMMPVMTLSVFEIIMLLCFGAAWPFSISRSYRSRSNAGKSLGFLYVVLTGYIAGVLHKIIYNYDAVIYLYALNGVLVMVDIMLYYRNGRLARKNAAGW